MSAPPMTFILPLRVDEYGTIRVGETRVTLDTVIAAYQAGQHPESIAAQFPAVTLAEVYATIAYYLHNRESVDAYLAERMAQAERWATYWEAKSNPPGLRDQLAGRLGNKDE